MTRTRNAAQPAAVAPGRGLLRAESRDCATFCGTFVYAPIAAGLATLAGFGAA